MVVLFNFSQMELDFGNRVMLLVFYWVSCDGELIIVDDFKVVVRRIGEEIGWGGWVLF